MQIIQPLLGTQVKPLGQKSYLGYQIKPLVTAKPLFPTSKLFLSRKRPPFIDTLVADGYDLDILDIATDTEIGFDGFDSPLEANTSDKSTSLSFDISHVSNVLQTQIADNVSNDILTETSVQSKTQTTKKPKSQSKKASQSKSAKKSKPKKTSKSTTNKKTQIIDKTAVFPISYQGSILTTDNLQAEIDINSPTQAIHNTLDNNSTLLPKVIEDESSVIADVLSDANNNENEETTIGDINASNLLADLALEAESHNSTEYTDITNTFNIQQNELVSETSTKSNILDDLQAKSEHQNIISANTGKDIDKILPDSNNLNTKSNLSHSHHKLDEVTEDISNIRLDIGQELPLLSDANKSNFVEGKSLVSETVSPKFEDTSNVSIYLDNTQEQPTASDINYLDNETASANEVIDSGNSIITPQKNYTNNLISEVIDNQTVENAINSSETQEYISSIETTIEVEKKTSISSVENIASLNNVNSHTSLEIENNNTTEPKIITPVTTSLIPPLEEVTTPTLSNIQPTLSHTTPEIEDNITELPTITPITAPLISPQIEAASTSDANAVTPEVTDISLTNQAEDLPIFRNIINNEESISSESSLVFNHLNLLTTNTSDISENTFPLDNTDRTVNIHIEPDTNFNDLPAPKGYATGGQVTATSVENHQPVAPSDTVPAMLTPGEFVINAKDAQKNLQVLKHINTGGLPEEVISPSLDVTTPQTSETNSLPFTTKVDSFGNTPLQRQSAEPDTFSEPTPLNSPSLGVEIGKQRRSLLNHPQDTIEHTTHVSPESSPHYSSPSLIFRKTNSTTNSQTPSQWSSVEELLNTDNDEFTNFNFGGGESNWQNSPSSQFTSSPTPSYIHTKRPPTIQGFANGGEVIAPDISRDIAPITETIQSPSSSSSTEENNDSEDGDIEALAQAIYDRLRQRIEIEKERQGIYVGRLPW